MTYEAPSAQPDQSHEFHRDRSQGAVRRPETELNDAGSIWTDTLQARLRELWEQGLTASQIAAELCITRNAVIGKAHRLGLGGRASPIQRTKAPKLTLVALKERMCK
jgi:GcrA cell cycle regulator